MGAIVEIANLNGVTAAIDLGSNSFHLIVARLDGQELIALERIKERVQLGRGARDGELSSAAVARGLDCIARFAQRIRSIAPERVVVVGTAALRDARNRQAFLTPAEELLGQPIRVLRGDEEAELIFLGVSHALSGSDDERLVIDIGGGSTELCMGKSFVPRRSASLALGCLRLTDRCIDESVSLAQGYAAARRDADSLVAAVAPRWRSEAARASAIGTSGTIEAVQNVLIASGIGAGVITHSDVAELERNILQRRWVSQFDIPGLAPERVDIFPAGLAALAAVMEGLEIGQLQYVDASLQHGLLYDLAARRSPENVQVRTIDGWQRRFQVDRAQAARVHRAASALLRFSADAWELSERGCAQRLGWAADLHEIGLLVSPRQPNRHGAYLVENGELSGFTAEERRVVALLIRAHRGGFPMFALGAVSIPAARRVRRLAILLRIAVILERSRTDADSPAASIQVSNDVVELTLPRGWLTEHALSRRELAWEHDRLAPAGITLTLLEG